MASNRPDRIRAEPAGRGGGPDEVCLAGVEERGRSRIDGGTYMQRGIRVPRMCADPYPEPDGYNTPITQSHLTCLRVGLDTDTQVPSTLSPGDPWSLSKDGDFFHYKELLY